MTKPIAEAPLAERIAKVGELIAGIDIAMLTTIDESGALRSRPMDTQRTEFAGTVWFFIYVDADKANDIRRDPRINLGYAKPGDQTYLSLAGRAKLSCDRAKMEELYNPMLEVWFPQGLETPGIALLEIEATSAHDWDSPANPVAQLVGLVKTKASGQPQLVDEDEVLDLDRR